MSIEIFFEIYTYTFCILISIGYVLSGFYKEYRTFDAVEMIIMTVIPEKISTFGGWLKDDNISFVIFNSLEIVFFLVFFPVPLFCTVLGALTNFLPD